MTQKKFSESQEIFLIYTQNTNYEVYMSHETVEKNITKLLTSAFNSIAFHTMTKVLPNLP